MSFVQPDGSEVQTMPKPLDCILSQEEGADMNVVLDGSIRREVDAHVVFYNEEDIPKLVTHHALPSQLGMDLKRRVGSVTWYYPSAQLVPRVALVSLGKCEEMRRKHMTESIKAALAAVQSKELTSLSVQVPEMLVRDGQKQGHLSDPAYAHVIRWSSPVADWIDAVTRACFAYTYRFDRYLKTHEKTKQKKLQKVHLQVSPKFEDPVQFGDLSKVMERAQTIMRAQKWARDLTNERGEVATPEWYEKQAFDLVARHSTYLGMQTIHESELLSLGLNLLHAVGKGARVPPRLVLVRYNGAPHSNEQIALVGKGVTFDTGGLNIKPTGSIESMYMDNAGAAAVLATLQACTELKLPRNIIAVLALAENAIGRDAVLPSSILTSYHGHTVEITNTDAEGRLALADALSYVQRHHNPTCIIDIATLTGACMVALGRSMGGLFSNDDSLAHSLDEAGRRTQELVWPLPISNDHLKEVCGHQSDLQNCSRVRYGGASSAAAFLHNFIKHDVPWAHLDIAGPSTIVQDKNESASGFGVQLLVDWLDHF